MDSELKKIFGEIKKTRIDPAAKSVLREKVLLSARGYEPAYEEATPKRSWFLASHRIFAYVAVAVIFVGGVGISYSAETSLPGEALYQVKVVLNESVLRVFSVTQESRISFEANMADRRLSEAEVLLEKGELSGDIKNNLLEQALQRVDKFVTKTGDLNEKTVKEEEKEPSAESVVGEVVIESEVLATTTEDRFEKEKKDIKEGLSEARDRIEKAKSSLRVERGQDVRKGVERAVINANEARTLIRGAMEDRRGENNKSEEQKTGEKEGGDEN